MFRAGLHSTMHILAITGLVVAMASCATVPKPCATGIEYQGRSYAGNAAYGLLGIQAASGVQAVRQVSDTLQIYLHQSSALCMERERGTLTPEDYLEKRRALSERFAQFAGFTKQAPPADIRATDAALYGETVAAFDPRQRLEPLQASMRVVTADNRVLSDGGVLHSGDRFRIEVDLSRQAWLYLVLKDASGELYKMYPSQAAGGGNPASGTVVIPEDGMLTLDKVTGTETIYLFAGDRSTALESSLEEIGTVPKSPKIQGMLASAVRFRGVFVSKQDQVSTGGKSVDALGQAAVVFRIEHR